MQFTSCKDPELLQINIRELLDHIYGVMLTQNPSISGWWKIIGFNNRTAIITELIRAALGSEDIHVARPIVPLGADIVFHEVKVLLQESGMDYALIEPLCFTILELIYDYLKTNFPNIILTQGLLDYRLEYLKCDLLILRKISSLTGANYGVTRQ